MFSTVLPIVCALHKPGFPLRMWLRDTQVCWAHSLPPGGPAQAWREGQLWPPPLLAHLLCLPPSPLPPSPLRALGMTWGPPRKAGPAAPSQGPQLRPTGTNPFPLSGYSHSFQGLGRGYPWALIPTTAHGPERSHSEGPLHVPTPKGLGNIVLLAGGRVAREFCRWYC